jgi:hypothetical protein
MGVLVVVLLRGLPAGVLGVAGRLQGGSIVSR